VDFPLYASVLWRFRRLVALGVLLAVALATLSMARVGSGGIEYRQSELWSSTTRLGVTQRGFPEGRLFAVGATPEDAVKLGIPIADPNRFNTLAVLYAELATSDLVRRQMIRDGGPIRGKVLATQVVAGENRVPLPLIDVLAIATSPLGAVELAQRTASALTIYLRRQQEVNDVPTEDRVVVQQLVRPKAPKIFQPRSKTMPLVVFFAVMLATVGLAFLLENLRPRVREFTEAAEAESEFQGPARRRSA
jgi:hypothetical protein